MAYTAVPTKAAGDTLTETNWNTHIRDNFAAGVPDIIVDKGDLVAGTAADAAARVAVGTVDHSILVPDTTEATGLEWQDVPAARVYNSSAIDPATSSWVSLAFDSERTDIQGMHSASSQRLTVPAGGGGLYLVGGCVEFDTASKGTGGGTYGMRILLNGTTVIAQQLQGLLHGNYAISMTIQTLYQMPAADYVVLQVYTSIDVDVASSGNYGPEFWAVWQRRL